MTKDDTKARELSEVALAIAMEWCGKNNALHYTLAKMIEAGIYRDREDRKEPPLKLEPIEIDSMIVTCPMSNCHHRFEVNTPKRDIEAGLMRLAEANSDIYKRQDGICLVFRPALGWVVCDREHTQLTDKIFDTPGEAVRKAMEELDK